MSDFVYSFDVMVSRIKQLKKELKVTNIGLAELSGVPIGTLNKILGSETKEPSVNAIIKIAEALGVSANYLIYGKEGRKPFGLEPVEISHIEKYRTLDNHGREVVDSLLGAEHERMKQLERERKEKEQKKAIQTAAKHDDDEAARQLPLFEYPASAGTGVFAGEGAYEMVEVSDDIPGNATFGVRIRGDSMEPKIPDGSIVWVRQQPDVDYGEICIVVIEEEGYCKVKTMEGFESLNPEYPTIRPSLSDVVRISGKVVHIQELD